MEANAVPAGIAIDPVCGMSVRVDAAEADGLISEHDGRTFAFCREAGKVMMRLRSGRFVNFATVATPLAWHELTAALTPDRFTIQTVPERLANLAEDPWADLPKLRQPLPKV